MKLFSGMSATELHLRDVYNLSRAWCDAAMQRVIVTLHES
jgi:hypothetical protein